MQSTNILVCVFFFYIAFDLLSALFMFENHPKATQNYYEMVFSSTGLICILISLMMTLLLYSNLQCVRSK